MEENNNQEDAGYTDQSPLQDATLSASSSEFAIGQLVALRSDPTRIGVVIQCFTQKHLIDLQGAT